MTRLARAFAHLLAAAALSLLALAPARAEPVSAEDTRAVRAVVEAQLAAFAADDAKRAFSYAAPAIRAMYRTPDRFLQMVRTGYPVIYRPASVVFLNPELVQGRLVQGVHLTDSAGGLWLAIYQFEQQPDRAWRINGCNVQPSSGKMT